MNTSEYVILLHGLARTKKCMTKLEKSLVEKGFKVININYPSRKNTIEELSNSIIPQAIENCNKFGAKKIHFVTHSLGGIIVRYYLAKNNISNLGRVVMLSPPNKGSEVPDKLKNLFFYKLFNGPAGQQLGTKSDLIKNLGKINFELAVITGDRTINFILSSMIKGIDDGKVSVENTKIEGMKDFSIVHTAHPFIMKNKKAIKQTISFLTTGKLRS